MKRLTRIYSPATRNHARTLRQQGFTYTEIIAELGGDIPKNTISDWVKDIPLTSERQLRIKNIELAGAAYGRELAAEWNREQKHQRIEVAETWADEMVKPILDNPYTLLAFMSALWLGEGSKKDNVLEFTNSDPKIIEGWLILLRSLFEIEERKLRGQILINHRMDESECCSFWTELTKIPLTQFHKPQIDERNGKKQREGYRGVLRVTYSCSDLRRKVGALGFAILRELNK
jgi:hypothetical protein